MLFRSNNLPLSVWFEGVKAGQELVFNDSTGKPHVMTIHKVSRVNTEGYSTVNYSLDSEFMTYDVKIRDAVNAAKNLEMADEKNNYHAGSPSNGDLWIVYVEPGEIVKAGTELFNISIMKQEKAVYSKVDGIVKRVLKTADYKETRKMVTVKAGELIVELAPVPLSCSHSNCGKPLPQPGLDFCPCCGG